MQNGKDTNGNKNKDDDESDVAQADATTINVIKFNINKKMINNYTKTRKK